MVRSRVSSRTRTLTVAVLGPVLAISLAACGGSSSGSTSAAATPTARPTGGFRGNGANSAEFAKIQSCLSAAGISLPTRSNFPRPSGTATGPRPTGVRPSGGYGGVRPSGGRGFGGGGQFANKKVQAALKACGITIPTGRPRAIGSPAA
jgi:hypothetical protein